MEVLGFVQAATAKSKADLQVPLLTFINLFLPYLTSVYSIKSQPSASGILKTEGQLLLKIINLKEQAVTLFTKYK